MPNFSYKAKNQAGELIIGIISAENQKVVVTKLDEMGYFPISINQQVLRNEDVTIFQRVNRDDLSIFVRQLADLLEGGISLGNALTIIYQQTKNKKLRMIIKEIISEVQNGVALSVALARHNRYFSLPLISMVRSGELGGTLNEVLSRLADYLEKEEELKGKIVSALSYPLILSGVGLITIIFLMTMVIPRLVTMFDDMNQVLPLPTKALIFTSGFMHKYWWLMIACGVIIFLGIKRTFTTKQIHSLLLSLPLCGELIRKIEIERFTRSMGSLLKNGVPILEALRVVMDSVNNIMIKEELSMVYKKVNEGKGLAEALRETKHLSPMVVEMISISEKGGFLEKALLKVASSYEQGIERSLKIMTSLIEPIVILGMGLIVGFITIAMLLPIFKLNILVE
ncbi:type II secretion system F family protein [bacterium]|nr:type II secretion system F family protein [bacterium]MBU1754266.1 type II secretion system F family protein [bacterium]